MKSCSLAATALALATVTAGVAAAELEGPIAITAGGSPVDTEHAGNAAPFVVDFDGDGRKDLLVGERYMGRLRIYRNVGNNQQPRFDRFSVFQDGAPEGRVPSG